MLMANTVRAAKMRRGSLEVMLRVGLTGGLGSGKSTVAEYLRELGAEVIEADELGRALMEPGQPVYAEIVRVFGPEVVGPDGRLNRARLAEMAFQGRAAQRVECHCASGGDCRSAQLDGPVFARNPAAVAVVESALIFEVERDAAPAAKARPCWLTGGGALTASSWSLRPTS
jgi:dephospho-CoA kinase